MMHDGPREEVHGSLPAAASGSGHVRDRVFLPVPTLQFALNHNWRENIPVEGDVLKKQFQMSWLLSRSQRRVNSSACAPAAVVSGSGGRVAVCFAFWKRGAASRLAPVTPHPFSFAITAVIVQPLLERLAENVSLALPLLANLCVGILIIFLFVA